MGKGRQQTGFSLDILKKLETEKHDNWFSLCSLLIPFHNPSLELGGGGSWRGHHTQGGSSHWLVSEKKFLGGTLRSARGIGCPTQVNTIIPTTSSSRSPRHHALELSYTQLALGELHNCPYCQALSCVRGCLWLSFYYPDYQVFSSKKLK